MTIWRIFQKKDFCESLTIISLYLKLFLFVYLLLHEEKKLFKTKKKFLSTMSKDELTNIIMLSIKKIYVD
jgi:hypothetical protein